MSTKLIDVLTDVPIPPKNNGVERKYPFETMPVGGMFFVEGRTVASFSTYATKVGKDLGRKFRTRPITMRPHKTKGWIVCEPDHPLAVSGVGCWRIA